MQNPVARKNGLVIQETPDEVLVYDLDANKAHCLNETSAFVWKSCTGGNSVADIVREFESTTGKSVNDDLVWLAIDQLGDNGLLEAGMTARFAGQSRRDVIKKIGLASMVALPVVASLVAPPNALAVGSCACLNPGSCSNSPNGCTSMSVCNMTNNVCAPEAAPVGRGTYKK